MRTGTGGSIDPSAWRLEAMSKNARYAWRLSLGGLLLGLLACAVYLLAVPLGFKYGEIQVGHGLEHEGGSPGTPPASRISARRTWRTAISCSATATPGIACGRWSSPAAMPAGRSPVFGAKTLPMDRFARTLGFRRTAEGIYANWTRPRASCCNATATGSTPTWSWPRRRCRWNSAWCATNGRGLGGRWTACPCTCSIPGP